MTRYPSKKIETFISRKIDYIENNVKKVLDCGDTYGYSIPDEYMYETLAPIKLTKIEFNKPEKDFSAYTKSNIYDLKFTITYANTDYNFETSNYYYYEKDDSFYIEDILENAKPLLDKFEYLLEWEDYIFKVDSDYDDEEDMDDEDNMTIDDVADSCGFYIDDDNHWIPKDDYSFDDFDEDARFRENLELVNGYHIYNDVDDNGRFYWK